MLKAYIQTFKRLFTDPSIYRDLLFTKISVAIKHFFLSYTIFTILLTTYLSVIITPSVFNFLKDNAQTLIDHYPPDLIISIHDGTLTTNGAPPPIIIPLTPNSSPNPNLNNLVVIQPTAVAEDILTTGAYVFLTQKSLAFRLNPDSQQLRIITWNELAIDSDINFTQVVTQAQEFIRYLNTYRPFTFLFIIIPVFIILTFIRLINALLYTLIISTLGSFIRKPYPYRSYFNLILYILILTEIVNLAQLFIYQQTFSNLYAITFWGITALVIRILPRAVRIKT